MGTPEMGSGAVALLFLEFGLDAILLEAGQVVDKDLALEVIHFMLDADGQQALRFQSEVTAIEPLSPYLDAFSAFDLVINSGNREATLFAILQSVPLQNLRILVTSQWFNRMRSESNDLNDHTTAYSDSGWTALLQSSCPFTR